MGRSSRSPIAAVSGQISEFVAAASSAGAPPEAAVRLGGRLAFAVLVSLYGRRELALPLPPLQADGLKAGLAEYDSFFRTSLFGKASARMSRIPQAALTALLKGLGACGSLNLEQLGAVYERCVSQQDSKKEGVFYTPRPVAQSIVRDALAALTCQPDQRKGGAFTLLDPACGAGVFLAEAYRALLKRMSQGGPVGFESKARLLHGSVYGVDRDEEAVLTARLLLQLVLLEDRQLELFAEVGLPDLGNNIVCGNSLLEPKDFGDSLEERRLAREAKAFSWQAAFPQVFAQGGFDCIVGNPPYGLARDEQIPPAENEKLKAVYHGSRSGKLNKYLAFMAKGYQLLSPQGVLSYIVPNAWLGIKGGLALRRILLEDRALASLRVYQSPVFEDPSVEAVVFVAVKQGGCDRIKVHRTSAASGPDERFTVPAALCLQNPDCTIPVLWSPEVGGVFEHVGRLCRRVSEAPSPFRPMIALQAYARGKGAPPQTEDDVRRHVFDRSTKEDDATMPYLQGADVRRYRIVWSGQYLRYGPWLAEPQKPERFKGPRLLVREITGAPPYILHACYTEDHFLYNKSVLHVLPRNGAGAEELLALLAVLNSKFGSFMITFRGRKSQRKLFSKIVNEDLQDFPLPPESSAWIAPLAAMTRQMMKSVSGGPSALPELLKLEARIDQAVFAAYQLPSRLTRVVKRSMDG